MGSDPRGMVVSQITTAVSRSVGNAPATLRAAHYGRAAAYRRLSSYAALRPIPRAASLLARQLAHYENPRSAQPPFAVLTRSLHSSVPQFQQPKPQEEVRDPPREEKEEKKAVDSEQSEEKGEKKAADSEQSDKKSEETKDDEKGEEGEKKDDDAKAPPPPHGDKTPWQVFTETLQTEFKASKEWQDSTKQLAGEVKTFSESEGVRRAREASEAASSGIGKVVKGTGKVVGQSAAWTWNTTAVQGTRAGINAVGRGIEQVTRPVRETKAFKEISDAIDDGSSSRYGGWAEKEERRLRRQRNDMKNPHQKMEKIDEDPE